jgi:hypothetical protein
MERPDTIVGPGTTIVVSPPREFLKGLFLTRNE